MRAAGPAVAFAALISTVLPALTSSAAPGTDPPPTEKLKGAPLFAASGQSATQLAASNLPPNGIASFYDYRGRTWGSAAAYPVSVEVLTTGLPAGINSSDFIAAIVIAIQSWNTWWPGANDFLQSGGTRPGTPLLNNSRNEVGFGTPPPECLLAWGSVVAVACSRSSNNLIFEIDVYFNSAKTWYFAGDDVSVDNLNGEVQGATDLNLLPCRPSSLPDPCGFELGNSAAHELGNFADLWDLGHGSGPLAGFVNGDPCDYLEARDADRPETMFACVYQRETDKRSLFLGDILGLIAHWRAVPV